MVWAENDYVHSAGNQRIIPGEREEFSMNYCKKCSELQEKLRCQPEIKAGQPEKAFLRPEILFPGAHSHKMTAGLGG